MNRFRTSVLTMIAVLFGSAIGALAQVPKGALEGTYIGNPGNVSYVLITTSTGAPLPNNCTVDTYEFSYRGVVVMGRGTITVQMCPGVLPVVTALHNGVTHKGRILDNTHFQLDNVPVFNKLETVTFTKQ
jgi:hypothetical protein